LSSDVSHSYSSIQVALKFAAIALKSHSNAEHRDDCKHISEDYINCLNHILNSFQKAFHEEIDPFTALSSFSAKFKIKSPTQGKLTL
jgi:hypothetical protein